VLTYELLYTVYGFRIYTCNIGTLFFGLEKNITRIRLGTTAIHSIHHDKEEEEQGNNDCDDDVNSYEHSLRQSEETFLKMETSARNCTIF
jgi:hypothetical protein